MRTARSIQNNLQQANGVNAFDQTIRNSLHGVNMRARLSLVCRVLRALHCRA